VTSRTPPRKLTASLRRHDPAIKSLAYALRSRILDEISPCHERMFAQKNKVVVLFAATDHAIEDCICQIHVFVKHVQLAFPRGVDLHDAGGVLQGSGKAFRHVKLTSRADVERPEIRSLLREASASAREASYGGQAT
jgi:hypothetical protein